MSQKTRIRRCCEKHYELPVAIPLDYYLKKSKQEIVQIQLDLAKSADQFLMNTFFEEFWRDYQSEIREAVGRPFFDFSWSFKEIKDQEIGICLVYRMLDVVVVFINLPVSEKSSVAEAVNSITDDETNEKVH